MHAMVCRDPREYNRPISQWSGREPVMNLVNKRIVEQISPRQVGCWLAEARLKPHQFSSTGYFPHFNFELFKVEDIRH